MYTLRVPNLYYEMCPKHSCGEREKVKRSKEGDIKHDTNDHCSVVSHVVL